MKTSHTGYEFDLDGDDLDCRLVFKQIERHYLEEKRTLNAGKDGFFSSLLDNTLIDKNF